MYGFAFVLGEHLTNRVFLISLNLIFRLITKIGAPPPGLPPPSCKIVYILKCRLFWLYRWPTHPPFGLFHNLWLFFWWLPILNSYWGFNFYETFYIFCALSLLTPISMGGGRGGGNHHPLSKNWDFLLTWDQSVNLSFKTFSGVQFESKRPNLFWFLVHFFF